MKMDNKHTNSNHSSARGEKRDTGAHSSRIILNDLHTEQEASSRYKMKKEEEGIFYTSFISLVFLPYIIGMLLSLGLFYFYMGIPIKDFFHVYSGLSQLLFWVFGIYLIITLVDIWLIVKKLFSKEGRGV